MMTSPFEKTVGLTKSGVWALVKALVVVSKISISLIVISPLVNTSEAKAGILRSLPELMIDPV